MKIRSSYTLPAGISIKMVDYSLTVAISRK